MPRRMTEADYTNALKEFSASLPDLGETAKSCPVDSADNKNIGNIRNRCVTTNSEKIINA
jgi:hypothetical protein